MKFPILKLTFSNLAHRPLGTLLTVATLATAVALISLIFQFGGHAEDRVEKDIAGVDLVVGAKGSPLQLVLSSLLHIDVPTGNMPLADAQSLMRDSQVKEAIPLALGDSFRGSRIVGTTHEFSSLYQANLQSGHMWSQPQQVVIGASVHSKLGMEIGQQFVGGHGLSSTGDGQAEHAHAPYQVTGILEPTGSIIDRLILTSIDSVWLAHNMGNHDAHEDEEHHHDHGEDHTELTDLHSTDPEGLEITALLIKYQSPIAAVRLPRAINAKAGLQAAAPAIELTRIFNLSSSMANAAKAVAVLLTLIGGLSIFIAVSNASAAGLYDIALMRAMGASPGMVFMQRILEGAFIAATSGATGILGAHIAVSIAHQTYEPVSVFGLSGFQFFITELYLFLATVIIGAFAALWPALTCYRVSPSLLLQRGR